MTDTAFSGPVLFAYDGSELAALAIEEARRQLVRGRDGLAVCVWQPADVGFVPVGGYHVDAANAAEVRSAAEATAAQGASLAESAGFRARGTAIEAAPTWQGIVRAAERSDASLIVLGSHGRSGLTGHLFGSVARAVAGHCGRSVLIVQHAS